MPTIYEIQQIFYLFIYYLMSFSDQSITEMPILKKHQSSSSYEN